MSTSTHDILNDENYLQMDLHIHPQAIELGPFLLSHEPIIEDGKYNIAGHIHPGVKLRGRGRQSQRIACFQFGKNSALMPAFGDLTGLHVLRHYVTGQWGDNTDLVGAKTKGYSVYKTFTYNIPAEYHQSSPNNPSKSEGVAVLSDMKVVVFISKGQGGEILNAVEIEL